MDKKELNNILPDWAMDMNCAVTVADANGKIIYMNEKSRATFASRGGVEIIGHNLAEYHAERSMGIIHHMLATGESNCYTIEKGDVRKMIYQTPWRDAEGNIAGLVEISIVLPENLPHYIR